MDAEDEDAIPAHYPPADISSAEFETVVVDFLVAYGRELEDYRVSSHEAIAGVDGTFDFDSTVRFRTLGGVEFLVVVEAKRHKNPIKRELIQALHQKALSVGAQKAWLISTARFQRGAVVFARVHGIALMTLTEGRFAFETRGAGPTPPLSREQASRLGLPTFVGVYVEAGDSPDSWSQGVVTADDPRRVRDVFGAPDEAGVIGP
jgi:hypothetical protein